MNLPSQSKLPMELAVGKISEEDHAELDKCGWQLRESSTLSEPSKYHDYICSSLGEFTAAKEQYVRPRTGWFSDRSVCYLAAGRPVITQETGFSNMIPAGEGLLPFSTGEEALSAIATLSADYARHSAAAKAIAHEYFDAERVLGNVLRVAGLM